MKLLLAVVVLAAFLAAASAIEKCRTSDDCQEDECCISRGLFRKGKCAKLANIGEKCSEEHDAHGFFEERYDHYCPCLSGLTCEPTDSRDTWFGTIKVNPRCVGDIGRTTPAETEIPGTQTVSEAPSESPETAAEPETTAAPAEA